MVEMLSLYYGNSALASDDAENARGHWSFFRPSLWMIKFRHSPQTVQAKRCFFDYNL